MAAPYRWSTRYIDDYHAQVSGEVYHICQFAEMLERGKGVCRPEPEIGADRMAWALGRRNSLAVEYCAGRWKYHLYDDKCNEIKRGTLRADGSPINDVRDSIIAENRLGYCSMRQTGYDLLMKRATERRREARSEKRESVLGQISNLQTGEKESVAPALAKRRSVNSR